MLLYKTELQDTKLYTPGFTICLVETHSRKRMGYDAIFAAKLMANWPFIQLKLRLQTCSDTDTDTDTDTGADLTV